MASLPKESTQNHLDIEDIIDDLVILKSGWVSLVLSTTAVNFDLLSEAEQDATIYAYGAFLNSLTFPVEILIRSKKADITSYFHHLKEAEANQPNPDLKLQIQKYEEFIKTTVQQKVVLDKKFYIIINFSLLEIGIMGFGRKKQTPKRLELLSEAKASLAPKRDHVISQTARLGLFTRQMTTQELIELFYDIYNPAPIGTQRVLLDSTSYITPIVEPAVEIPSSAPSPVGELTPPNQGAQSTNPNYQTTQPASPAGGQPSLRPAPPRGEPAPPRGEPAPPNPNQEAAK